MKTSEPNEYGEVDCKCNRCGGIKQSLPYMICDHFDKCGGCYEAIEYQKCEDAMYKEFEKYFDAEFGLGEGVANMDEHYKTWKAAFEVGQTASEVVITTQREQLRQLAEKLIEAHSYECRYCPHDTDQCGCEEQKCIDGQGCQCESCKLARGILKEQG